MTTTESTLAALGTPIAPVRKPAGYRVSAALVAVGMVLLPTLYVALVAGLVWSVVWYAGFGLGIFESGAGLMRVVVYIGPLAVGAITVIALIKPLFAPRRKRSEPVTLSREAEPTLHAVAEALADTVGAPRPRRIDVDTRANASASFRRGVLSMFGRDLVLTIGLPLADALSVRQFAGVLAHEYGHFAQGGGMRLTYLTESISRWFERVVYERDVFDEWLDDAVESTGGWVQLVLGLARGGAAVGRWVLRGLMTLGRRLSRGLLRQMEFDADRYEVRVGGARTFQETSDRITLLGLAEQATYAEVDARVREQRVPDDLPAFIAITRAELPPETVEAILADARAATTGPLDTHPSLSERIANAEREGGNGLPLPDTPARALFSDFDALARRATKALYDEVLVREGTQITLVSTEETLAERAAETASFDALARLCGGGSPPSLDPASLSDAPMDPLVTLASARDRTVALAGGVHPILDRLATAYDAHVRAEQADALARAAVPFQATEYGLEHASREAAQEAAAHHIAERDAAEADLAPLHDAVRDRVGAARALVRAAGPATEAEAVERWLRTIGVINAEREELRALRIGLARTGVLVETVLARQAASQSDEYTAQLAVEAAGDLRQRLWGLRKRLASEPYPFQHGAGALSLSEYAVPTLPGPNDVGPVLQATDGAIANLDEMRARAWAALAGSVERIEAAHGFEPLPDPPVPDPPTSNPPSPDETVSETAA
ncbi:MAG: M48 family metallopeptidase [Bacteroidota bacterium]